MNFTEEHIKTDFLIIGGGVAGLRAAIELARNGEVLVVTKDAPSESSSEYAQGGVAVALSDEDEISIHFDDTIRAGDGLCLRKAVGTLVEEGPTRIRELILWGAEFDKEGTKLAFTQEAAHTKRRILHAQGDSTGKEIMRVLIDKVRSTGNGIQDRLCLHPGPDHREQPMRRGGGLPAGIAQGPHHFRAGGASRHGRRGPAVRAHDQSRRRDRRRHGHGLSRRRSARGHGVRSISPHRPLSRGRAPVPAFRGHARRRRHAQEHPRPALHGPLPSRARARAARRGHPRHPLRDGRHRVRQCISRHDPLERRLRDPAFSRASTGPARTSASTSRRSRSRSRPRPTTSWAA